MAKKPVSLSQQIEEVERELADRKRRLAIAVPGRERSLAEYRLAHLEAALATLQWLKTHDQAIKAAASRHGDLPFKVERWSADDTRLEGALAASDNLAIARAAFDAAVKAYPAARLTLRDGIRIIAKHPSA
jgi:hypothetical protein